ncbi:hypothetical protein EVAR_62004_1 [Eumeta japonica]|uniref:Uncharacterized protein n=1 Tax=Eumeta variegata TaxID=151549 RepID=A0A4C1YJD4_EUMVA|nr:hypothetical protein EVAR_62004_1 [Eumeta japonica]
MSKSTATIALPICEKCNFTVSRRPAFVPFRRRLLLARRRRPASAGREDYDERSYLPPIRICCVNSRAESPRSASARVNLHFLGRDAACDAARPNASAHSRADGRSEK